MSNVDTAPTTTHVSLCAGYGGIDLGLKRAVPSLRTIAFSEIEAYACANLVAKMEAGWLDAAPIWTDIKTFPWEQFRGCVDILSGGYPCQPFSAAGKRLGKDDPRHLWPWIADGIRAMQPGLCFFENVEGHISLGLRDVIGELEAIGYRATWGIFSAAEVGAPHQRKRVFIMAHRFQSRLEGLCRDGANRDQPGWFGADTIGPVAEGRFCQPWPSRPGEPQYEWEPARVTGGMPPRVVGDTEGRQDFGREHGGMGDSQATGRRFDNATDLAGASVAHAIRPDEARGIATGMEAEGRGAHHQPGGSSASPGQAQPRLGGLPDGPANRVDRLRLAGNGVVPATAERAFRILFARLYNPQPQ